MEKYDEYATVEESIKLARTLLKDKGIEYQLVGLINRELMASPIMKLIKNKEDLDFWEGMGYGYTEVFDDKISGKIHEGKTEKELVRYVYEKGTGDELHKNIQQMLADRGETTLVELNKEQYPVTTEQGLYIGDPCYVINEEDWSDFVDEYRIARKAGFTHFKFKGFTVGVTRTAHGDGSYTGTDGYSYSVDAGLLGVVPLELVEDKEKSERLGRIIEVSFLKSRLMRKDKKVCIYLEGKTICIDTGWEYFEEDEGDIEGDYFDIEYDWVKDVVADSLDYLDKMKEEILNSI